MNREGARAERGTSISEDFSTPWKIQPSSRRKRPSPEQEGTQIEVLGSVWCWGGELELVPQKGFSSGKEEEVLLLGAGSESGLESRGYSEHFCEETALIRK